MIGRMTRTKHKAIAAAIIALGISFFLLATNGWAAAPSLEDIIAGVEKRYQGAAFSADFKQISTIKAMDIADTATGRVYIKHPGKMRWEYLQPDQQIVVTDGVQIHIYRPLDKQVLVGKAPEILGSGKGAGFLADIKSIRNSFAMTLAGTDDKGHFLVNMVPRNKVADLDHVVLTIRRDTFDVVTIATYNEYGDETRIDLIGLRFDAAMADNLFNFEAPAGTNVLPWNP